MIVSRQLTNPIHKENAINDKGYIIEDDLRALIGGQEAICVLVFDCAGNAHAEGVVVDLLVGVMNS